MIATVFVEPHERLEALEAYRHRLTAEQIREIEESEGAIIQLQFDGRGAKVTIIPEG